MFRLTAACVLASCAFLAAADDGKRAPRSYTNDDLDRYAHLRSEEPADVVDDAPRPARSGGRRAPREAAAKTSGGGSARGEEYWRREAERTEDAVRRLREQAADVAEKVSDLRRQPDVRPYSDPRIVRLERRRLALEERAREAELRLVDRARRAGALPGWLR
ncbi:MAG: hypothetical protein ABW221_24930 [Vicinamibacteria bacterium]